MRAPRGEYDATIAVAIGDGARRKTIMARNVLLLTIGSTESTRAAALAAAAGGEVGLVSTAIALRQEKVSGGRIEDERCYAGSDVSALDEPIFIGSAIAQLAGHCDAVIVDRLDSWSERLLQRFPTDPVERDAEIASLVSVMQARMADLIVIAAADRPRAEGARELFERALAAVRRNADEVVAAEGG